MRLNIGAGGKRIEGWLSIDLAGDPDIVSDVRTLPLDDNVADEAMAIHVLEHLYRWDAPAAIAEWLRVLKPGGRMAIEVPDLIKCCRNVLSSPDERLGVWGLMGDPGYREPLMVHKWCWSADELKREMQAAGFVKVKVGEPQFHKKKRDMRLEGRKP